MTREEIKMLSDGLFTRFEAMMKKLQCEGCQERRVPEKPNVVSVAASGFREIFVKVPSVGVLESVPVGGNLFVIPGRSPADNLQTATGNPGVVRHGLDMVFPRRGWYTLWNNGTSAAKVCIAEAQDGVHSTVVRDGVKIPTVTNPVAGVAAGIVVAANPRRRFLSITNSDSAAGDIAFIHIVNTVSATNYMMALFSLTSASVGSQGKKCSFGPGGTFPLYLGDIYAIRSAGDTTLTAVEWE